MKRGVPHRRKLYRPPQRDEDDKVTPGLHAAVLARDRMCVLAKLESGHVCKTAWGREHMPDDLALLTLEHVHDQSMMGKRAPSDLDHCLALCGLANVNVPSKAQRALFRLYLARANGAP